MCGRKRCRSIRRDCSLERTDKWSPFENGGLQLESEREEPPHRLILDLDKTVIVLLAAGHVTWTEDKGEAKVPQSA